MTQSNGSRSSNPGNLPARETVQANPACYQEGEYWTFVYGGTVCRLRDAKGLHCLAYLLRHPGERFAAVHLLTIAGDHRSDGPSARGGPGPEEARVLVTKRIRGVVKKIEAHHPSLAHHLGTCIKTGAHCAYLPDPERPLLWAAREAANQDR